MREVDHFIFDEPVEMSLSEYSRWEGRVSVMLKQRGLMLKKKTSGNLMSVTVVPRRGFR